MPRPDKSSLSGAPASTTSQTLDRGLRVLERVAQSERPLSAGDVAEQLGLHRSITYRMLRTLQDHELVARDRVGHYVPGRGLAVLARQVAYPLTSTALPHLEELANDTRMTSFLVVRHGEEALTVAVVEPRVSEAHVIYRPGGRHPIARGAPGLALLAGNPPQAGERTEVTKVRRRGWAYSEGEVIPGLQACAAPVVDGLGGCPAAVSVVFVGDVDLEPLGALVQRTAERLSADL